MPRSARPAERRPASRRAPRRRQPNAIAAFVARNPAAIAGTTGFLVALAFVSANAIWYQPHAHKHAFFPTRSLARADGRALAEPETTIVIERPAPPAQAVSDPVTAKVQSVLKSLGFYAGPIDGRLGAATAKAIQAYRARMGMSASPTIDADLLDHLGVQQTTSSITPVPSPRGTDTPAQPVIAAPSDPKALVVAIQKGLRAFGATDIGTDGVAGARTRAAIGDFQDFVNLPRTGEPDVAVYAKLKLLGLTD